ncbi:hypothetical protein F5Y15DRAFT_273810 [Xylariaceae sp. FL0016]|nr:hypothetical protein F5Y15DRAFT_273810 [Xylariaceae sp. FL0016]
MSSPNTDPEPGIMGPPRPPSRSHNSPVYSHPISHRPILRDPCRPVAPVRSVSTGPRYPGPWGYPSFLSSPYNRPSRFQPNNGRAISSTSPIQHHGHPPSALGFLPFSRSPLRYQDGEGGIVPLRQQYADASPSHRLQAVSSPEGQRNRPSSVPIRPQAPIDISGSPQTSLPRSASAFDGDTLPPRRPPVFPKRRAKETQGQTPEDTKDKPTPKANASATPGATRKTIKRGTANTATAKPKSSTNTMKKATTKTTGPKRDMEATKIEATPTTKRNPAKPATTRIESSTKSVKKANNNTTGTKRALEPTENEATRRSTRNTRSKVSRRPLDSLPSSDPASLDDAVTKTREVTECDSSAIPEAAPKIMNDTISISTAQITRPFSPRATRMLDLQIDLLGQLAALDESTDELIKDLLSIPEDKDCGSV